MTDTTIRVETETRQWLKVYASMHGCTQNQAIKELLEKNDTPKPEN